MDSKESLVYTTLSGLKELSKVHCVQFIGYPECLLLNVPAQEHIPQQERIGNYSLVVGDSCT